MRSRAVISRIALALVIAISAVLLSSQWIGFDPALLENAIGALGSWAAVAHVLLFAAATVVFFPGTVLGVTGGVLFGPFWGTILNLLGATLGATLSFLIARYIAADVVKRKAGARLRRLIAGVEAEGWRFVALVRLIPLFPFNVTNYALGVTRISLQHYVLASLICMAPETLAYTWLGHAGREALAGNSSAIRHGLIALALLAAVVLGPRFARRVRPEVQPSDIEGHELARRKPSSPDA